MLNLQEYTRFAAEIQLAPHNTIDWLARVLEAIGRSDHTTLMRRMTATSRIYLTALCFTILLVTPLVV